MSRNYIDNHDGTYTIEDTQVCCQNVTKTDLQQHIANATAQIAALTARKISLQEDLDAINALPTT